METGNVQVVADNMILREDGKLMIVESMYSGINNLSVDTGELLGRIHPVKRQLYDRIARGEMLETTAELKNGRIVRAHIHSRIEIHVNRPDGGIQGLDYTALTYSGENSVIGETAAQRFDAAGEPVIRQMRDRSFRLLFLSLPPQKHALGGRFNMDHFGTSLIRSSKAPVTWDDRDVFHIGATATRDDILHLLHFLAKYRGKQ